MAYSRKRIMVFDVETTGLIPKQMPDEPRLALDKMPHIIQLSFVIFDTQYWRVVKSCDVYINVAPEIVISPKITELTGITREMCDKSGIPIEDALYEFYTEYFQCNMIVAHNLEFDREMLLVEFERLSDDNRFTKLKDVFDPIQEKMNGIELYCTMKIGRNICKISAENSHGKYWKNPKLSELYEHYFGYVPENLHNSIMDAYVCLRCFVKMRFRFDLRLPFEKMVYNIK